MDDEAKLALAADKQFRFDCLNLIVTTFVVEQSVDQVIEAAAKFENYVMNGATNNG
jgi:hypothetical protein